tara:strand:- start:473 stop:4882 length:4410 start_codon:yes stop_codon:yes gene_type:complete
MTSRLERYKSRISKERELNSDIKELESIYLSSNQFYQNYDFTEFVKLATENSAQPLGPSIKEFFENPYNPNSPITVLPKTEDEMLERRGFQSLRRAIVSPISESTAALLNIGMNTGPFGFGSTYRHLLPDNTNELVNRSVDAAFRQVVGKELYDEKVDKKTGEVYYELEKPTTTAESLARTVGELGLGLLVTRKPTAAILDTFKTAPKRTRGRPSKKQLAAEKRVATRTKRLERFDPLIKAEVAAQFNFVDDPEFNVVAGALSNFIGDDESKLAALFNYLDTDEDSPEAARRLSLLLDGMTFAGLFGTALGVGKITVKGVTQMINSIKASGPEAVNKFKSIISTNRRNETASKKVKPTVSKPIVPMITNLKSVGEDNFFNKAWRGLQRSYYSIASRDGMYAPGTLNIIKKSEYNKIAWSDRAIDIHAKLTSTMNDIAKQGKYTVDELEDLFGYYLSQTKKDGKLVTLKMLPKDLQQYAKQSREYIDALSEMLMQSKFISKELKTQINDNLGKYLRKTYEAFENPNYKPSAQVVDRAKSFIIKSLKAKDVNAGRVRPRPDGYYESKSLQIIDDLLRKQAGKPFVNFEQHINSVFGAKKADIVFAVRKNINPVIRELLGEEKLATTSVFRTIERLSREISDHRLMDDLYNAGLGKWFFTGKGKNSVAPNAYMTSGRIVGEKFHKLNGVRTTPEIAKLFANMNNVGDISTLAQFYSYFLKLKGFGQASATVYNLTTHLRNTIGGGIILARNGLNPFSNETVDSLKILRERLTPFKTAKEKNDELVKIYQEYQSLGLVNQNVRVGEFKALFNDYVLNPKTSIIENPKQALNKFSRLNKKITDVYVAEDDLWRIAGYNKELQVLRQAYPDRSLQSLKEEAATIIRNTMPTYDLIAPGIQQLRRLPIGNFFSFTAEQFRNNYHTLSRSIDEIRTGNEVLVQRGLQRLASQIAVTYTTNKGLTDLTKYQFGITDEDEKAIRDLSLPEWSKNSTLVFDRTEDGSIEYIDMTYVDPSAPVTDVVRAFLNEITDSSIPADVPRNKLGKAVSEAAKQFLKPFVGSAIFTDRLLDIAFGQGRDLETGQLIDGYNTLEGPFNIDNIVAAFKHSGEGLIPRELRDDFSLIAGEKRKKIDKGEISIGNELFARFTGQRVIQLTPSKLEQDFKFKLYDLNDKHSAARDKLSKSIEDNLTPDELLERFKKTNNSYYKHFVRGKLAFEAALHFNLDFKKISNTADSALSRFTNAELNNFLTANNSFIPVKFTNNQLSRFRSIGNFREKSFYNFYEEYTDLYLDYHNLPIIEDIDNEYRTYSTRELLGRRSPLFEGGPLDVENPVEDVKDVSADRVDPLTGEPYSFVGLTETEKQMRRFGLMDNRVKLNQGTSQPMFEQRINNPADYPFLLREDGKKMTHRMADDGKMVYPMIQLQEDGTLKDYKDDFDSAREQAIKTGNYKVFETESEAQEYARGGYKTKEFKEYYK